MYLHTHIACIETTHTFKGVVLYLCFVEPLVMDSTTLPVCMWKVDGNLNALYW
jgi:hypothetical protein